MNTQITETTQITEMATQLAVIGKWLIEQGHHSITHVDMDITSKGNTCETTTYTLTVQSSDDKLLAEFDRDGHAIQWI